MADYLAWRCPGDHEHLPLEGSLPGIGSLTKAAGAYQTTFCYDIGAAIDCLFYEPEEFALEGGEWEIEDMGEYTPSVAGTEQREPDEPNHEPAPPVDSDVRVQSYKATGVLQRLQRQDRQLAKRTVSRLHRNLGHPTNAELKRLLEMTGASSVLVECVQEHDCDVCRQQQHRPQVPVSSVPSVQEFNARVQADTLWIKIPNMKKALPILMISDTATRFLAGRVIWKESPEDAKPQDSQNNNEENEAPTDDPAAPSNEAAPQEMPPAPVPEHQKRLYEPTVNESFRNLQKPEKQSGQTRDTVLSEEANGVWTHEVRDCPVNALRSGGHRGHEHAD